MPNGWLLNKRLIPAWVLRYVGFSASFAEISGLFNTPHVSFHF